MKAFFAVSCLVAVAYARPGVLLSGALPYNGVAPLSSQYHAQDELGQYSYGYAAGPSSKQETRTADGITQGSFSYVDSHGLVQSRSYVSDPVNGFRVAASDLPVGPAPVAAAAPIAVAAPLAAAAPVHIAAVPNPVADTVEVAAAKARHYAAVAEVRARNGDDVLIGAAPVAVAAPVAAPVAIAAPVAAHAHGLNSQYHAQDELGQYSYGYAGGLSAKNEQKTADGITRGSFSYVDAHGLVQSRSYVSDPVNGFRVAASDLPVGPAPVVAAAAPIAVAAPAPVYAAAAPIYAPAAPIAAAPIAAAPAAIVSDDTVLVGGSPADTPEVAAAKAAHFAAHHEAHARLAHAY